MKASIPKSTDSSGENVIQKVVDDVENHVFNPKPGGLIDQWHKEKLRQDVIRQQAEEAAEKISEPSALTVKVAQVQPELIAVNVVTIPAGSFAMLLPANPFRYKARIAVITTAVTILLAKDESQATSGIGLPVSASSEPFEVTSRAQLWASSVNAAQVAVFSELYASADNSR